MGNSTDNAKKAHADFQEKVKRTVYLDNLSPQATSAVLKTALGQFGTVLSVYFIPNYLEPRDIPQCALVEMENPKQAKAVVREMTNYPFMISGMPRPVRAQPAKEENFTDRPRDPDRKIEVRWLGPSEPDFETAQKLKHLVKKHAAESAALLKHQLEEEEKLAKQQAEMLKSNHKKYEMIENMVQDGSLYKLAGYYNVNLTDFNQD